STIGGPSALPQRWPAVLMASKPIETGVVTVKIGDGKEYDYSAARIRIKAGTAVTFTNDGKVNQDGVASRRRQWDNGVLAGRGCTDRRRRPGDGQPQRGHDGAGRHPGLGPDQGAPRRFQLRRA